MLTATIHAFGFTFDVPARKLDKLTTSTVELSPCNVLTVYAHCTDSEGIPYSEEYFETARERDDSERANGLEYCNGEIIEAEAFAEINHGGRDGWTEYIPCIVLVDMDYCTAS